MTDDEHDMIRESLEVAKEARDLAKEALKENRKVAEWLHGTPEENSAKPPKTSRAAMVDRIIFGWQASKWGYRIIIGFLAFIALVGGAYQVARGWKP